MSEITDETVAEIMAERRGVSEAGREVLARAVSINHDWALRASSEDKLIEAVSDLPDEDLEGAYLLAHYLTEAIGCEGIRRDMERDRRAKIAEG